MYIGSGIQSLNQQNHSADKKGRKDSAESKGFYDFMDKAKKKEPVRERQTESSYGSRKRDKSRELGNGENQQASRIENRAEKRKTQDSSPRQSEKVDTVSKDESSNNQSSKMQARNSDQAQKESGKNQQVAEKNLGVEGKQENQPLSTISSETTKTTLEENQKKLNKMEQAFSEMMSQSKNKNTIKNQGGMLGQNMGGVKNLSQSPFKSLGQNGKMKIDSEMTLNDKLETLETIGQQNNPLKSVTGAKDSDGQMEQDLTSFEQLMGGEGEVKTSENANLKSAFAEEVTLAQGEGKAQKIENMQSIIKQARAVVDDGGGSMEVHLQPEGLGKVHLKVAVNDGQVNVEMMTDNQLAKKALEEGILDIKQALEGQKLLVETVKVEMSPDYQKDFSDLQDHMQEQANRDFAEQFLGQFQREREERLGGMFDAFRNFRPGADEPDLNMGRNPYTENGKGRSINLVA